MYVYAHYFRSLTILLIKTYNDKHKQITNSRVTSRVPLLDTVSMKLMFAPFVRSINGKIEKKITTFSFLSHLKET